MKTLPHDHGQKFEQMCEQIPGPEAFQIVADLFKQMGEMSSPAVSHHLKQLKMTGLIISRREGKEVYYKAADTVQAQMLHHMIEQAIEISCPYSIDDRQKEDA